MLSINYANNHLVETGVHKTMIRAIAAQRQKVYRNISRHPLMICGRDTLNSIHQAHNPRIMN